MRVKICGITNLEDAETAVEAGADALGFVFCADSPRNVTPEQAESIIRRLPPFVQMVGLFVNAPLDTVNQMADSCGLDIVQLHGEESPEFCAAVRRRTIKAFRVQGAASLDLLQHYPDSTCLLDAWSPDAHGGTGHTFNWDLAADVAARRRVILAGGLTPQNVAEAVRRVRPYAVDVSSGVEAAKGKKDRELAREFIRTAKEALR